MQRRYDRRMIDAMRLLVGDDGSEGSRDALELARVLASVEDGAVERAASTAAPPPKR